MPEMWSEAWPPGMAAEMEWRHPLDIIMRDTAVRRQWNAERLAFAEHVNAALEESLRHPPEHHTGHLITPGDPNATPADKAPRPSLGVLTEDEIEQFCWQQLWEKK